jgi:hypothetical protein
MPKVAGSLAASGKISKLNREIDYSVKGQLCRDGDRQVDALVHGVSFTLRLLSNTIRDSGFPGEITPWQMRTESDVL